MKFGLLTNPKRFYIADKRKNQIGFSLHPFLLSVYQDWLDNLSTWNLHCVRDIHLEPFFISSFRIWRNPQIFWQLYFVLVSFQNVSIWLHMCNEQLRVQYDLINMQVCSIAPMGNSFPKRNIKVTNHVNMTLRRVICLITNSTLLMRSLSYWCNERHNDLLQSFWWELRILSKKLKGA